MVADLPTIPERHLLAAFLELDADLPAIAARTRTPLTDLTRWANTEAVQAWLDAHRFIAHISREQRDFARVRRTLDHLEKLQQETDHPIEKRRILTAILRASTALLSCSRARSHHHRAEPPDTCTPRSTPSNAPSAPPTTPRVTAPPRAPQAVAPVTSVAAAPAVPAVPVVSAVPRLPEPLLPLTRVYAQDLPLALPKRTARSAASLIAAAGLPGP